MGLWLRRRMSHSVTRSAYGVMAQPQYRGLFTVDIPGIADMGKTTCRWGVEIGKGHRLSGFYFATTLAPPACICGTCDGRASVPIFIQVNPPAHDSCSQPSVRATKKLAESSAPLWLSTVPIDIVLEKKTGKSLDRGILGSFFGKGRCARGKLEP